MFRVDFHNNGCLVIEGAGVLDAHTISSLDKGVDNFLFVNEERLSTGEKVVVDMSEIDFVDAAGVGFMVRLQNKLEEINSNVVLHVVATKAHVLKILKMQKVFPVHDSLHTAYKAIYAQH